MKWGYGIIKEKDKLLIAEIYCDDNNEIQRVCCNFADEAKIDLDSVTEDLSQADRYFEFDEDNNKWITHIIKEK